MARVYLRAAFGHANPLLAVACPFGIVEAQQHAAGERFNNRPGNLEREDKAAFEREHDA